MDNAFMTIEQVAEGLKVFPKDVLQWVSEGKLKAISEGGAHLISVEEYQKYGQSFPPELRAKLGEYLWHTQLLIAPEIEKDVADRFRTNTRIVLQRDKIAITLLETIHKKYEPQIDIFNDKRGYVATFILYARIISLLNSIVLLLESGVPSESFLLLRPLWEAALLAEYFALSEINHENEQQIRRWFEKDETPPARDVRYYIANKTGMPLNMLKDLNRSYSKPIHHAYSVIMESYRGISMTGFLGDFSQRQGFDYHQSRIMRDIATLVAVFEGLLLACLQRFYRFFFSSITMEENKKLEEEMVFYSQELSARLESIFLDYASK